jgi:hypothetical protein
VVGQHVAEAAADRGVAGEVAEVVLAAGERLDLGRFRRPDAGGEAAGIEGGRQRREVAVADRRGADPAVALLAAAAPVVLRLIDGADVVELDPLGRVGMIAEVLEDVRQVAGELLLGPGGYCSDRAGRCW